jgi:hypothetical protein
LTTTLRNAADRWLLIAAAAHGAVLAIAALLATRGDTLALFASAVLVAVALWWTSNTVSHNHLHNPIFRSRVYNRGFSLYLTLVIGLPQSYWRARHLWHHAGEPRERRPRLGRRGASEALLVFVAWAVALWSMPGFFLAAYAPGYALGLLLCWLQGRYEHPAGEVAVSHYGKLYNRCWFNDGHHVEHHARPGAHWTELPTLRIRTVDAESAASALPPVVRWLEGAVNRWLGGLEELTLGSATLQRFMVDSHARAFAPMLQALPRIRRIAIVGGGLFPRTVLVLKRLLPSCELTVIDASAANIAVARRHLERAGQLTGVHFVENFYHPDRGVDGVDLVVVPLAFDGDRALLEEAAARVPVLVHDWIWRRRSSHTRVVSWLLLKRVSVLGVPTLDAAVVSAAASVR